MEGRQKRRADDGCDGFGDGGCEVRSPRLGIGHGVERSGNSSGSLQGEGKGRGRRMCGGCRRSLSGEMAGMLDGETPGVSSIGEGIDDPEQTRALAEATTAIQGREPEALHMSIQHIIHLQQRANSPFMNGLLQKVLSQLRATFNEIKAEWEDRQSRQRMELLKLLWEAKQALQELLDCHEDEGEFILEKGSGAIQTMRCHLDSADLLLSARFVKGLEPMSGGDLAIEKEFSQALLKEAELRSNIFERAQCVHVAVHDAISAKRDYERLSSHDELKVQVLELSKLLRTAPGRFRAAQADLSYAQQILKEIEAVWEKEMEDREKRRPPWMPDSSANECMKCKSKFGLFRRRHHCRACGLILCSNCSYRKKVLPAFAYFKPERVCESCFPLNHEPQDWWDIKV